MASLRIWPPTSCSTTRCCRATAADQNDIRAMGFAHNQLFDGTTLRAVPVIDTLTGLSPILGVRLSYQCRDIGEALECGTAEFGYPKTIRVDNSPRFISKEPYLWAYRKSVVPAFIRPENPRTMPSLNRNKMIHFKLSNDLIWDRGQFGPHGSREDADPSCRS